MQDRRTKDRRIADRRQEVRTGSKDRRKGAIRGMNR
jgi:hypothetical protein